MAEQSNPRWRAAAEAALRLPSDRYAGTEFDSLARRFYATAEREGFVGGELRSRVEAYRGYWVTAAKHIADALEDRLLALNSSDAWGHYRKDMPAKPPSHLPMSFDRTDILYTFEGRRGVQAISYRWVTADRPVDSYGVVGWYFNEPDAPVEVLPLANCELDGDLIERPEGGRLARLRFEHTLSPGESYFFAYMTVFHSQQPCRPIIRYETRGSYAGQFTVRSQFDPAALPILCWVLDAGFHDQGLDVPEPDDPKVLSVASNGYVEHTFDQFDRGRKYGLRWMW